MILRSPAEDENRAAHYPNANIEKVRHSLPLATRFALLGESEGDAVSPSSDLPRSRIEGYGAAKHTRVTALRPLSLHSLSPRFS